ncbi:MAG: sigma-70 family RNA polymerase sigma factor [Propionicimonas sp.]|uniref:RNA polymerase sigma factor n=1 Tax=Propionicimonas sp. TaxID=1955623 RepID=UPI002B20EBB4|nr:sigma-70 family RNA polymerase sigma factor [Propionicimonas sp.]MEA4944846.1 sigma-70 family RNA polymerase sigma factor [Propionicimonas sp.]MEA5052886.1 sigma-70 family RNA polymerase sigma factor [Propionicimonas sp.]MEA5117600.1 sigma-70 family RNA polymerase sigma factor [Propionicimonas sp.]
MSSDAVARWASGEAASTPDFEDYVTTRQDVLVRTACLVVRDWAEAQDAVQDALVSLWPRWHVIPAERLDAYVHRTVVNACLMRLRGRRRLSPVAEPTSLPQATTATDPAEQWVLADQAWRLCGELPPVQRAAVVLRFYRDLSFAEVAAALDCPEATARSHVHRAIAALRKRYEEDRDA